MNLKKLLEKHTHNDVNQAGESVTVIDLPEFLKEAKESPTVDAKKLIVDLVAENADLRESNEALKRTAKYHQLQHQRNARNFRRTADKFIDMRAGLIIRVAGLMILCNQATKEGLSQWKAYDKILEFLITKK